MVIMKAMIKNIGLVLLSIIIALILVEVVLRVFELAPTTGISSVSETEFNSIPGIFTPGQKVLDKHIPELPHSVSINNLGYRGVEIDEVKIDEVFRIIVVGDSLTYGDYVDDDQTLPAQLEKGLRENCNDVQVINGGVGGSTITEHKEMIKRAKVLNPDLVILQFYENDINDLSHVPMWEQLAINRGKKSSFPLSLIYPVVKDLALWNFSLTIIAKARMSGGKEKEESAGESQIDKKARLHKLRERYKNHLIELDRYLNSEQTSFLFTVYPSHQNYTVSSDQVLAGGFNIGWAALLARQQNIKSFNVLPALRETSLDTDALYLLPHDGHPSPLGYQVAASALAKKIIDEAYIPARFCN